MARASEVISAADFLLQYADLGREELNGTAAIGANHVVMATPVVLMLVTGDAVMEGDFAGQAALGKQFQGAVYGGVSDTGVFLLHQAMEFVRGKVITRLQEGPQDGIALGGLFEADTLEMAMEDILRLADHLAGECGLVVDALLKHGAASQDTTAPS